MRLATKKGGEHCCTSPKNQDFLKIKTRLADPTGYSPPRVQYAHGIHGLLRAMSYSLCLKVSKFQVKNKSKTHQESLLLLSFLLRSGYKKRAEGLKHLSTWGLRLPYTNKHKQPTPQNGRTAHRQTDIQNTNVAGRCGRKTYRRRERLPRPLCRNCRSFR